MIRYLIFTKRENGLNIILSDRDKVENGEVMAVIQSEFNHNFRFLWEMVRERGENLKSADEESSISDSSSPFKVYQLNQADYIIDMIQLKLINSFLCSH